MSGSSQKREAARAALREEQARQQEITGRLPVEIEFTLAICLALFVLGAVVFGNMATALVGVLIGATTVRGYFKGAIRMAALVVALIAAWLLAFPLGRAIDAPFSAAFGTGGLLNRILCIGVAGTIILIVLTIAASLISRRALRTQTRARAWDRGAGAGLGFLEGALIGTAVLWLVIALEPLAAATLVRAEHAARFGGPAPPAAGELVARNIVAFADQARRSAVGEAASGVLPSEELRLVRVMNDFAIVSQDRRAMQSFLESDAMKRLRDLPSVQKAGEIMQSDPAVEAMIEKGEVTSADLRELLGSGAVLRALDSTRIVSEAGPLVPDIEEALLDAKAKIDASGARTAGEGGAFEQQTLR